MSETNADSDSSGIIKILVVSIHQELGETFLQSVCPGSEGPEGSAVIDGRAVRFKILAGDSRLIPPWDEEVRRADALALLVRFLDVLSLDKIRAIYRKLPIERNIPMAVYVFREDGEIDFKMSCLACGQKLWVRDTDVDKRGRCPNCKKSFRLPSQSGLLKSQLLLPDAVPIVTVTRGSSQSCKAAVAVLLPYVTGMIGGEDSLMDQETLKKTTVRIQVTLDP